MKKFVVLLILLSFGSFGYTCEQRDQCHMQVRHMSGDEKFCLSDQGILHINTMYIKFLKKKALDKQDRLGIVVDGVAVENEEPKPVLTFDKKEGDIKCYLQDRNMYHSDEWIGDVEYNNNIFTYYSKFKEERITVSGPCVVREEKE